MRVALDMGESEFIGMVEDAVRPVDQSAKVIPLSGSTFSKTTVVKTLSLGVVSPMETREAVYDELMALSKPYRELVTYEGWALATNNVSAAAADFSMVVHTISARLKRDGC